MLFDLQLARCCNMFTDAVRATTPSHPQSPLIYTDAFHSPRRQEVIKKKDASSIDPLLAACGAANGIFWGIYGTAINDLYVSVPNGIGAVMSTMSTLARLIIGVKK